MEKELRHILDSSGNSLVQLTERFPAVDAKLFSDNPIENEDINPLYTLSDQLYVEPQPIVFPTKLELYGEIRMSRTEIAVARSHINVWRKVALGEDEYVLVLEDDTWCHSNFAKKLGQAWRELIVENNKEVKLDILYLSYLEVKNGAPKRFISKNVFHPLRGLWYLSGYVLSREGAKKILSLLPCRGPIDLWINHQFKSIGVCAIKSSLISQRRDIKSSNSYSILPALTKIGAINSEGASLFNIRPIEYPVFAFGPEGSGHSPLAMALSMLGYRCCSDLKGLPLLEMNLLFKGKKNRVFDAYVNIGSLDSKIFELRSIYPQAKFIITTVDGVIEELLANKLKGVDVAILPVNYLNKWQVVCEYLRCAPPTSSFPVVEDLGQRLIIDDYFDNRQGVKDRIPRHDNSPWLIKSHKWWKGISIDPANANQVKNETTVKINDRLEHLNTNYWHLRSDTFTDNLALFRPSNVEFNIETGARFSIKKESLGVRNYSASSLCSINQYLFGKFEAIIQASNVPGIVTGIFLHRNSPRQEIDIEIAGNRPSRLIINVFYNPGDEGANFDYGYRGSPFYIELGFDASKACHRYAIEWTPHEIRWLVDDRVVYKRVMWDPTPIPNLPMTFHVNSWVTRSTKLAGKINNRKLPATVTLREISVEASCVIPVSPYNAHPQFQYELGNSN